MRKLAETVFTFISCEKLLQPGDRVGVAVSGGADSVALLRLMLELRSEIGILLWVAHFNHKLRGDESEADESFVRDLSKRHGLEFLSSSGDVAHHAKEKHSSLEAAARELRYAFFLDVMRDARLNRIATAHTLDDQAETVLLKIARGAGTRGLAGIYPKLDVNQSSSGEPHDLAADQLIIRPLLGVCRRDVELYLRDLGQPWREDRSNRDLRHSRNVVRHGILPRLERNLNPAVREALGETAEIARAEEEYWNERMTRLLPNALKSFTPRAGAMLDGPLLTAQPKAVQRRLIRALAESLGFELEFKHVEQVLRLALDFHGHQSIVLPGGWMVSRSADGIRFQLSHSAASGEYEYRLSIPGRIEVPEAGRLIEAVVVRPGLESAYNPDHAIDAAFVGRELQVRNWRPGDRFWPGHSKSPKKIKELLQERHVTGMDRKRVPVVVSGTEVVWVQGLPAPTALRHRDPKREAIVILDSEI